MNASDIDLLVRFGVVAIVIVTIVVILKYLGIVIPQIVYIILGAIAGIVLLVWAAGFLKALA